MPFVFQKAFFLSEIFLNSALNYIRHANIYRFSSLCAALYQPDE